MHSPFITLLPTGCYLVYSFVCVHRPFTRVRTASVWTGNWHSVGVSGILIEREEGQEYSADENELSLVVVLAYLRTRLRLSPKGDQGESITSSVMKSPGLLLADVNIKQAGKHGGGLMCL